MKKRLLPALALFAFCPALVACGGSASAEDLNWDGMDPEELGLDVDKMSEECQAITYASLAILSEKVDTDSLRTVGKILDDKVAPGAADYMNKVADMVSDNKIDLDKMGELEEDSKNAEIGEKISAYMDDNCE